MIPFTKNQKLVMATTVPFEFYWLHHANFMVKYNRSYLSLLKKQKQNKTQKKHGNFFKKWPCPNFSCCPKNLSCPKFGGCSPPSPLARKPMSTLTLSEPQAYKCNVDK